jgi:hypothetical protein
MIRGMAGALGLSVVKALVVDEQIVFKVLTYHSLPFAAVNNTKSGCKAFVYIFVPWITTLSKNAFERLRQ